ncbi:MAG: UDP-N-acetylmuramoyl-tripeptide--D-alanyl-D-alanine ligase [Opitutales bacterium]|nr:UDP-N-acetylmuramoyl-tripeptide--D-alanyl-D-alanine ligase [Opitutales bacterium]
MPLFDPEILAQWCGGRWNHLPSMPVRGFSIDTRSLRPDELFIAVRTERRDGHTFLGAAEAAGAAGAVVDRVRPELALPQLVVRAPVRALQSMAREHRRTFKGPVIGVTGSCGKTSTKELLARLLGSEHTHRTPGNLNNHLGVPLTLLGLEAGVHRAAVVEAGINRRGEMDELGSMIAPDVVVVTTVGAAHLERLGSLEAVAREKAALARYAGEGAFFVWPAECERFAPFRALREAGARIYAVSFEEPEPPGGPDSAECTQATQTTTDDGSTANLRGGCRLTMRQPPFAEALTVDLPVLSQGMVSNVALALTVARALGVGHGPLAERAALWAPSEGRGEVRRRDDRVYYVDCYNANPSSMRDSLEHFQKLFPTPPRCFVLGGMRELGPDTARLHADTASLLRLAGEDVALFVGEEAEWYAQGVRRAAESSNAAVRTFADAVEAAPAVAASEGPVFLKGSRRYALETLLPEEGGSAAC